MVINLDGLYNESFQIIELGTDKNYLIIIMDKLVKNNQGKSNSDLLDKIEQLKKQENTDINIQLAIVICDILINRGEYCIYEYREKLFNR